MNNMQMRPQEVHEASFPAIRTVMGGRDMSTRRTYMNMHLHRNPTHIFLSGRKVYVVHTCLFMLYFCGDRVFTVLTLQL